MVGTPCFPLIVSTHLGFVLNVPVVFRIWYRSLDTVYGFANQSALLSSS